MDALHPGADGRRVVFDENNYTVKIGIVGDGHVCAWERSQRLYFSTMDRGCQDTVSKKFAATESVGLEGHRPSEQGEY